MNINSRYCPIQKKQILIYFDWNRFTKIYILLALNLRKINNQMLPNKIRLFALNKQFCSTFASNDILNLILLVSLCYDVNESISVYFSISLIKSSVQYWLHNVNKLLVELYIIS